MPNPFNNYDGPQNNEVRRGDEETIAVHGEMFCERCFESTDEGVYHPGSKRLFWTCVHCGYPNAVKGIEIE